MTQAQRLEVSLDGATFERAMCLTHEAVSASLHGGPAGDGALEFVLTSAANDKLLSATISLLLANVSAVLARMVIDLESAAPDQVDSTAAEKLIEEILTQIRLRPHSEDTPSDSVQRGTFG